MSDLCRLAWVEVGLPSPSLSEFYFVLTAYAHSKFAAFFLVVVYIFNL